MDFESHFSDHETELEWSISDDPLTDKEIAEIRNSIILFQKNEM